MGQTFGTPGHSSRVEVLAIFISCLMFLLMGPRAYAAPPEKCLQQMPSFVVDIQIVKGTLRTANVDQSQIQCEDLLFANPKVPRDETQLKRLLAGDLDNALKSMSRLYWYGLTSKQQNDNAFQKNVPAFLLQSHTWAEWSQSYLSFFHTTQPPGGKDELTLLFLLNALQLAVQRAKDSSIPLKMPDSPPASGAKNGKLTFLIVAPNRLWSESITNPSDVLMFDDLADYLRSFDQGLWRQTYIEQLIADFYSRRGLSPQVVVPAAFLYKNGKPLSITIHPNSKIRFVNFKPHSENLADPTIDAPNKLDRDIALYNLFSTRNFKKITVLTPQPDKDKVYDSIEVPADIRPLFNAIPFASAQADLASRGFTVSNLADPDEPSQLIRVVKNDPDSKAGKQPGTVAVQPGAPAVPSARGSFPATDLFRSSSGPGKRLDPDPTEETSTQSTKALPKDKKGYAGLGFSYEPGQGVRPIGALDYQRLFGVADITLEAGSANDLPNGSGSASFDYLGFEKLKQHRLTIDLKGGSDSTYHRLIGIRQLNERRNGGTGHVQLEVIRDPLGSSLRFYADGGSQTVTLTDPKLSGVSATAISDTLASSDLGATYVLSLLQRARPLQLQVNPAIRAGSAGQGGFAKGSLAATLHQEGIQSFVFEMKVQFAAATDGTPVYEQPSLGGVSSLRGFRADDELALRTWAIQPEFWHGVLIRSDDRFAQLLNKGLRLAAFCDVGGAYQTYAGPPGAKAGPGAGVRFQYRQATFRLDWAYGLGTVATGPGHGRVYFSISTPIH